MKALSVLALLYSMDTVRIAWSVSGLALRALWSGGEAKVLPREVGRKIVPNDQDRGSSYRDTIARDSRDR